MFQAEQKTFQNLGSNTQNLVKVKTDICVLSLCSAARFSPLVYGSDEIAEIVKYRIIPLDTVCIQTAQLRA